MTLVSSKQKTRFQPETGNQEGNFKGGNSSPTLYIIKVLRVLYGADCLFSQIRLYLIKYLLQLEIMVDMLQGP